MKKSDSEAWKLAKRIARRNGCMWFPVELSDCGTIVTVESIIRGSRWKKNLESLKLLTE